MVKFASYVDLFEECLTEMSLCSVDDIAELFQQMKDWDSFKKVLHEWA